ncbi:MAG: hypothetical protein WKF79_06955 [Nocardioides sp.]
MPEPDEPTTQTPSTGEEGHATTLADGPQTSPAAAAPRPTSSRPESDQSAAAGEFDDDGQRETFDRAYIEELRKEAAGYRVRAKHADTLGARLVTAYAAQTGRLADATDLPYDAALCDDDGVPDPERVAAAVGALLETKPHLATRRPVGDVGQGARPGEPDGVSLAGLLRVGAG